MNSVEQKLIDVKLGSVIAEDIFANTPSPIIRKDTKITREHLLVLQAFHVSVVPIQVDHPFDLEEQPEESSSAVNSSPSSKNNDNLGNPEHAKSKDITSFSSLYTNGVQELKREFANWQAGTKVDVAKMRIMLLPMLEHTLINRTLISQLNDFSDVKDYMYHHMVASGLIAASIGQKMGFEKGIITQLATAALLSDCGMAKIDPRIRDKKGALTKEEFNEIKKHTIYSYQFIRDTPLLRPEMKLAIAQHHERLDGSGYPKGEKMEKISLYSQIIAVADIYHAMTSERVYRAKESTFKVLEMIREDEFGKFNIQAVDALTKVIGDLPIGIKVQISNGEMGEVIFLQTNTPTRPMVRLMETGEIINLAANRSLYIERIID